MFTVTFEADFKDLKYRFAKADKKLFESKSKEVRALGNRWVQIAREEAPIGKTTPDHPDNRRGGVKFKDSIRYETFIEGDTEGFRGISQQPLGKWIVYGTRRHDIPLTHYTKSLSFFWTKVGMETRVPKEGGNTKVRGDVLYIGKGYVDHPGTKPNPYTERAAIRLDTDEKLALQRIANQWVIAFGEA